MGCSLPLAASQGSARHPSLTNESDAPHPQPQPLRTHLVLQLQSNVVRLCDRHAARQHHLHFHVVPRPKVVASAHSDGAGGQGLFSPATQEVALRASGAVKPCGKARKDGMYRTACGTRTLLAKPLQLGCAAHLTTSTSSDGWCAAARACTWHVKASGAAWPTIFSTWEAGWEAAAAQAWGLHDEASSRRGGSQGGMGGQQASKHLHALRSACLGRAMHSALLPPWSAVCHTPVSM